jgi:heme exporter protein C
MTHRGNEQRVLATRWLTRSGIVAGLAMLVALYAALIYAPTERVMGVIQRVFYFHLASAWVGFFALFVAFAVSIAYLVKRSRALDIWATASVEIGVLFCTIVLLSGSIWARPIWNTWWTWDPRLTTTLILWIYYIGVLVLRSFVDEEEMRARYAAVLNTIGFVNVPLVFMAIRWWRTIHPVILDAQGMHLERPMIAALLISLLAFTLLYGCLLLWRVDLEYVADKLRWVKREIEARNG